MCYGLHITLETYIYYLMKGILLYQFSVVTAPNGLNNSVDWLQNLDTLKESVRLAGSGTYKWEDLDLSQFPGTCDGIHFETCIMLSFDISIIYL